MTIVPFVPPRPKPKPSKYFESFDRYLATESTDPTWMIEGLWSDRSHGIVAGDPKTRKSYLALDIALSVATGTKCLGHFPVHRAESVAIIQEEISDNEMRKRLRWMAVSKGLGDVEKVGKDRWFITFPDSVPIYLRNRKAFDLSKEGVIEELAEELHACEIKLVILDPLQLMLGNADENSASSLRPILQKLLIMKEATECGVMIVHHNSKPSMTNARVGGQRMLGSQALHGWVESALYLSKPSAYVTKVEREFRNFDPMPDFEIEYVGGSELYEVVVREEQHEKQVKLTSLESYVMKHPGVSVLALCQSQGIGRDALMRHVDKSKFIEARDERSGEGRPKKRLYFIRKN